MQPNENLYTRWCDTGQRRGEGSLGITRAPMREPKDRGNGHEVGNGDAIADQCKAVHVSAIPGK